jgi:hypothetical protein
MITIWLRANCSLPFELADVCGTKRTPSIPDQLKTSCVGTGLLRTSIVRSTTLPPRSPTTSTVIGLDPSLPSHALLKVNVSDALKLAGAPPLL